MTEDLSTHYRQIISRRLRAARTARGFSRATLADRAGVQPEHLESFEQGNTSPSVDELERLAAALRIPLAHFMEACMLCGSHD